MDSMYWPENEPQILYVAVEYIKDDAFKLEAAGVDEGSGQIYAADQPRNDFEQHLEMLDVNLSVPQFNAVRFDPPPASNEDENKPQVPDAAQQSQGQVIVHQLVPSPIERAASDAIMHQSSADLISNDFLRMVDAPQEQGIPPPSEQDVDILITDQSTGMSYLVERCLNEPQLMDAAALLDSDLLSLDENALKSQLSDIIQSNIETSGGKGQLGLVAQPEESAGARRSMRNMPCLENTEIAPCLQQICDRPILTRARASLPVSHLVINRNQRGDESVFAKKFIPGRTQFGPIEGVLSRENIKCEQDQVHLSIENNGLLHRLDVSNENLSNWMCFVQLAPKQSQQNLILFQQDSNLYFLTTQNIQPKQELLVGYSSGYAHRRNLPVLEADFGEEDWWPCYECSLRFITSEALQQHLDSHDGSVCSNSSSKRDKKKKSDGIQDHKLVPESSVASAPQMKCEGTKKFKCPKCYKCFADTDRVQRHMMVHESNETKPLQCNKCSKRFLTNSALSCHMKTHSLGMRVHECPICKQTFAHVLQLKTHVGVHAVDGKFTCPVCTKVFAKYSIIRKHIRAFHCDKIHICPDCGKAFPNLDKLRMHLLRHSDHREFLCADCGKQFKRKDKLQEHSKKAHHEESELENAAPKTSARKHASAAEKSEPSDYHRYIYKCHKCLLGFKRRGMLVNHLAKRHPDIRPDTVPELKLPIYRTTKDYYCNYCDKIYKSSSKRKAHILKNHPGLALPLGHRDHRADANDASAELPNPTFSQTVGSITTDPQACCWCHRQYASKAKLLQHQRKIHAQLLEEKQRMRAAAAKSKLDRLPGGFSEVHENVQILEDIAQVGDAIESAANVGDASNDEDEYYGLITIANGQQTINSNPIDGDIVPDQRLYRLVNVENGSVMVPPR